ncbi:MAG: PQQ-binding-like beta-propeller repeat protein [Cypionkella sp.]|nr:PQQ-binding-like beta-propeller repeat protein [Cypionkella sp.]
MIKKSITRAKIGHIGIGLTLLATLAACEREVVLDGPRFSVRTPLAQTLTANGAPAAPLADGLSNQVAGISLPSAVNIGEWSHRAGSARHSLPHGALSAAPVLAFSAKIGAGNSRGARIAATPVASGGRIFAMDAGRSVSALTGGGAVIWTADVAAPFDPNGDLSGGGLATSGGAVYVTTGAGEVIALAANSGAVQWRQRLDGALSGPPTVDGGRVYVMGRNGSAAALDTNTGRILWQLEGAPRKGGMLGAGAIAADGSSVYLPYSAGQLDAVSRDGDVIWSAGIAGQRLGRASAGFGDVTGDPVIANGVIYVGSAAGRTAAISAATGQRIWTAGEGALNAPLVVGGSVFVVNDQARLVRMNAQTGAVIWAQTMPYFKNEKPKRFKGITAHYGPVLAGGRIVVASGDGTLRLFDPASGNIVGQAEIPSGAASAPALVGGMLLVMGQNGQLHAFR